MTNSSSEEELDEVFQKMVDGNRLNYVICCGTNADSNVEEMGLVEGHAYTVVITFPYRLTSSIVHENW